MAAELAARVYADEAELAAALLAAIGDVCRGWGLSAGRGTLCHWRLPSAVCAFPLPPRACAPLGVPGRSTLMTLCRGLPSAVWDVLLPERLKTCGC